MRKDNFTYTPQLKLVMIGNHAPALSTVDEAMRRRFHVIPFEHKPARKDPTLPAKLAAELPGILGWALHGLQDFLGGGSVFSVPAAVLAATRAYFDDQDALGTWLADHTIQDPAGFATSGELFKSWSEYAKLNNLPPGNSSDLKASLERKGYRYSRTSSARGFKGLRLPAAGLMEQAAIAALFK